MNVEYDATLKAHAEPPNRTLQAVHTGNHYPTYTRNSIYSLEHHSIVEDVTASPQVLTHQSETPSDSYHARNSSLNPDPMNGIPIDYHEFHKVFSGIKADTLPPHQPYDLQISLEEGAKPFHGPIYSPSPLELTALQEFLEEHTWNSFICPTKSPWGSPVLFIKKKDGSLYLCINFHTLNKVTEKDCYLLPLIMDLLNAPGPARIYLKINLKHAYHLVCIVEGDEPKMAFRTCYGSFKWRVMPFGLSNAPAVFQQFINDILGNLLDICVIDFIDNILIYSNSLDKHKDHVWDILQ